MSQAVENLIADVIARTPRGKQAEELCGKGDELLTDGEADGAQKCFDKALQIDPRSARAWTGRASILASKKRNGEALGCVDRALDVDASHAGAVALKADLLAKVGQRAEALACFDQALGGSPPAAKAAELWGRRARLLVELARLDDAIASYDRAIALAETPALWVERADLLLQKGAMDEVARCFERAVALNTMHLEGWYRLARTRLKLGQSDRAREALESFLAIAPDADSRVSSAQKMLVDLTAKPVVAAAPPPVQDPPPPVPEQPEPEPELTDIPLPPPSEPAKVGAGATLDDVEELLGARRFIDALKKLEPILKEQPDAAEPWFVRARILVSFGQTEEAITTLERVTRLERRHRKAWELMATCWAEMKRLDRAIEIADKVIALDPEDPSAHLLRARFLVDRKRTAEAREALATTVDLADKCRATPIATEARALLAKLA